MPLSFFTLASSASRRLRCRRVMRSSFRELGRVLAAGALVWFCSCDKHKLGEMPEVQKEHLPPGHSKAPAATATPQASATPAEFFPEQETP